MDSILNLNYHWEKQGSEERPKISLCTSITSILFFNNKFKNR